jgi:hypothetical protein
VYTAAGWDELSAAMAALAHDPHHLPSHDEDLPQDERLAGVTAPVFGPDGSLLFAINLAPDERYRVRDIPVLSRAVLRAAGRVMATNDGRPPAASRATAGDPATDLRDLDADAPVLTGPGEFA